KNTAARGRAARVEGRRGMKPVKLAAVVLAAAMAVGTGAAAQEHYPSRLITVVVPLTAGTTIDILARLFAESLSKRFGQQVIVANRPGAGGLIAAQAVATAPTDGYTVLLANSGHAILGTLNKNLPFDPIGGRIHVTFAPAAFTLPLLQDGRLLALAVAANEPIREPIAVPAALAAHIDYQNATWYGFLAPAKTPAAVLQTLHDAIVAVG